MIIGFGKINYHEPSNKYYLNTLSDLNIIKIDDEVLKEKFKNKEMKKTKYMKKDVLISEENTKYIPVNSVHTTQHQETLNTTPLHNNSNIQNELERTKPLSEKLAPIIENTFYNDNLPNKKSQERNSKISKLFKVFSSIFRK